MKTNLIVILLVFLGTNTIAQDVKKIVEGENLDKFKKYIDNGGELNQTIIHTYKSGGSEIYLEMPLLIFIIGEDETEMFDLYLDNLDKINNKEELISEAFAFSLSRDDEHYAEKLYTLKPNLSAACNICNGNNAIFLAVTYNKYDWYIKLKDQSNLLFVNSSGGTLLHAAANSQNSSIMDDVLQIDGIDAYLNKADSEGLTPLDYAIRGNDDNVFSLLLEAGADPKKSWNLFYGASFNFNQNIYMLDYVNNFEQKLIDEIWMTDKDGDVALVLLTYWNEERSVELLQDENNIQAKMIGESFAVMSQSLIDETLDPMEAYNKIKDKKTELMNGVWYFYANYTYFLENNSDLDLYSSYEDFLHKIGEDIIMLHNVILEKCNGEYLITSESYKYFVKLVGKDVASNYLTHCEDGMIEIGE